MTEEQRTDDRAAAGPVSHREVHTYLGTDPDAVFGVLHLPASGRARGSVLLLPSLAKEQFDATRGMRRLAAQLADRGLAVLRIDYLGTGDSAHSEDGDDAVEQWAASCRTGLAYLRELNAGPPAVVGLRAGCLMAARALTEGHETGPVVLWDPVSSGRAFLREQRALYLMTVGADDRSVSGSVPLIGTTLSETAAAALSGLRLDPERVGTGGRWLVATRPGGGDRKVEAFATAVDADRLDVEHMAEYVQPPDYLVRIPDDAIDAITDWLDTAATGPEVPVDPPIRRTARLRDPAGGEVTESIEYLGPHSLFSIRTTPPGHASESAGDATPGVLFFATANDTHHGPNREWVRLARRVAGTGVVAVRFDRRGAGESGVVLRGERAHGYSEEAREDADTAAAAADPDSAGLAAVGVCSGSWLTAHLGRESRLDAAVLVNPVIWSWRTKRALRNADGPDAQGVPRSDPAFQRSFRGRVKALLQSRLPYPAWRLLGIAGITQVPEVLLRPLADADVHTTVVLAPPDAEWFTGQRGGEGLRSLNRRSPAPRIDIVSTEFGDHPAYHADVRAAVAETVLQWCSDRGTVGSDRG
ncbi:alpha/beta hydrolase [Tsukamurella strandjordii]|uniref:alpha/beta hydrolase n=1 Tax=Tsukamurella TaxID=2060 RepID=UPI001C7CED00|nr:alpha/beta hydrolase [Tsukamurella sp. TY48]GIZ99387.1 hypothetical protein TTY48_39990 [Tsukamurella sp. TY48]